MNKIKTSSGRRAGIKRKILLEGSVSVETLVSEFNGSIRVSQRFFIKKAA